MTQGLLYRDLIETLWNVKEEEKVEETLKLYDLIETLWNVKKARDTSGLGVTIRFNRDIVECKVSDTFDSIIDRKRFNRDIVECKVDAMPPTSSVNDGFNRDIVECKGRTRSS